MEEKQITFEESLQRLEEIVRKLESGNALLDESLKLYEEGTALVKRCGTILDTAQQRVMQITDNNI